MIVGIFVGIIVGFVFGVVGFAAVIIVIDASLPRRRY